MKLYISYILTSILNFYVIVLYYGVSAGLANYGPVAALSGALMLFSIAAPIILYKTRIGLILGLIACLLILPFSVIFLKSIFEDGAFNWASLLIAFPSILTFISIYFSAKSLFNKNGLLDIHANKLVKLLLFIAPILMLILYFIFYGKYWSWNMLKI